MNVLVITTSFPATRNDYSGWFILKTLENMNMTFNVIVPADDRKNLETTFSRGQIHWVRYAPRCMSMLTSSVGGGGIPQNIKNRPFLIFLFPFMMFALLTRTLALAKRNRILHAHWLINGIIAALVKKLKGSPFVLTIRGSDQKLYRLPAFKTLAKWIFAQTDAITTVSQKLQDEISDKFKVGHKTFYIPNGTVLPRLSKRSGPNAVPRFIFVGSLTVQKGISDLMAAILQLRGGAKIKLHIIGIGPELQSLMKTVQENRLQDTVLFLGQRSPAQVQQQMLQSDCLILPSYSEGMPNVVKEAMACGLPVIATKVGGVPELITNGEQGLLFEAGDVDTLRNHINTILHKPGKAIKMGQKGRKLIIDQRLTWESTASSYSRLYRTLT